MRKHGASGPCQKKQPELRPINRKMKEAFREAGVQTARHICIHNREELVHALDELNFPVVVKAVDLMGSRGIFRCNTRQEALYNYEKTMEVYQTGVLPDRGIYRRERLFGAEAMVKDGKLVYCMIDIRRALSGAVPTPVGHSIPFEGGQTLELQAQEQVQAAIEAVGLDNCPVNCDLIHKEGKVYVIEITGRAGATCLPEQIGLYYGINYYEAIIRLAMDMEVESLFAQPPCTASISHTLMSDRDRNSKGNKQLQ